MRIIKKGATSQTLYFSILDNSSQSGAKKTSLAYNTSGLTAFYTRNGAAAVAITLVTQTASGAWTSGGFAEVSSSNVPGLYRLDVPDAAFATGVDSVIVTLAGATGMVQSEHLVQLVAIDLQDATRLGLSALPNAAAAANGGLPTGDANAAVKVQAGTGTGQLDFTSGVVKSNLVQILASAITGTAANIVGAFTTFFNVGSPTFTAASVNQTGDSFARLGAPSGASIAADIATRLASSGYTAPDNTTISAINTKLGTPAGASVSSDIAAVKSECDTILADVNTGAGALWNRIGAPAGASIAADIASVSTAVGTVNTLTTAVKAKTDNLPASPAATSDIPTANTNADALLDRANGIETGMTPRQSLRGIAAILFAKISGAGTGSEVFRNAIADSKDRITVVADASGNRTSVTVDLT